MAIYNTNIVKVTLDIWVKDSPGNTFDVKIDRSIVANDGADEGVDVFYLKYNSDDKDGDKILTIYPSMFWNLRHMYSANKLCR